MPKVGVPDHYFRLGTCHFCLGTCHLIVWLVVIIVSKNKISWENFEMHVKR